MKKVYLDNAATTKMDPEVLKAMQPYFCDIFGNASSLHSFGQAANKAVEQAREKIANFLSCNSQEIIFTSGATEADNLALRGAIDSCKLDKPHIITTTIEHPAILETCKYLGKKGVEVSYIKPQANGIVKVEDIEKEIKDNTILISIMYVNNEIGTIQPIREIGEMIRKHKNIKTLKHKNTSVYPLFHSDAVQAVNYCNMNINNLNLDLVSISGHKIYGPKGVGVLYIKKGTPLKNIQHGGHQEFGLRPGTINAPLIVGLGKAIELIQTRNNQSIKKLRDNLWQQIQDKIKNVKLNGNLEQRAPNNLNISFFGVEGEAMLLGLDLEGIAISTGSACSSGSLEPSHVLMSIGLAHEQAHGSLRITLGKDNVQEELDYFVEKLVEVINKYRKMAPEN